MSEPNEILAEKSAAEEASSVERCLTFESGGLTLFLSTNYVTEIINDCSITHLPLVPGHVKGILNLRGQILPVVDIRECMGKPSLEYTSKTCIIVLNVDEIPIGIVVDSVRQVVDIDLSHVRPIPVKRQQKLLDGMVTMEDGSVLMSFDCNSLAGNPASSQICKEVLMQLTDSDFTRLYTYVKNSYGIDLSKKKQLISSRLNNMLIQQGYRDFTQYTDEIISGKNPEMVSAMLNRLTTNYTYFLREKEHFDFLQKVVLPELAARHAQDHTLSIWSAGCSSGEEPYTISMYLKEFFSSLPGNWDTRILATDISQNVLSTAQSPAYTSESLAELPMEWQKKNFIQTGPGQYTVSPSLRQNVIFRTFNLMEPIHFKRKFDLIFCRNVMIYFDRPTKEALVQRFFQATVPGGYLFIGHSEGIDKGQCPYQYLHPAIYQKRLPGQERRPGGEKHA